jgi:hypothetical protein
MKWFLNIGNLAKAVGSILALTATIIVSVKGYNNWVINKADKEQVQQEIVTELKSLNVKVDSLVVGQEDVKDLVNDHTNKLEEVNRKQDVMKNIMTREFAKTMTPEQVLQMMNDFEKKNNGGTSMIQLPPNDFWTLTLK